MNSVWIYYIILFAALLVLLVWLGRYAWVAFKERPYSPPQWRDALEAGEVSGRLMELEKSYADKVRFHAFWIQVRRLKNLGVEGDFAELGVYQGETAAILHAMDPDRILHLFDTFKGFPEADLQGEVGKASEYTTDNFADTTVNRVLMTIQGGEKVKVHQGRFPETVPSEEYNYSLVSLDADLYKPTLAALRYFYPRLSPGGVIFVHDYSSDWQGIVRAVDEFTQAERLNPVLMPDQHGTTMIIKSMQDA